MASIRLFARPPLTSSVARRRCLRPRGMTAYPRAFNLAVYLAECVLFVLFYERQTPVFVLNVLSHMPNTSSSSCCLSGTHSSKSFAPHSSLAEHELGFVVPLRHAHLLHSFAPFEFFGHRVRG
jgi:hypothetical protein